MHTKIDKQKMALTTRSLQLKDFRLIQAIHETGQLGLAAE
jgi:hypothetical protein